MEVTEPLVAGGLLKNGVSYADIESNNGGRGFARKIDEMTGIKCAVSWFYQNTNKESRIISNAASVMQTIVFPDDWHIRWPEFYDHVTMFKRSFKANKHDDAPDVLTGIFEHRYDISTGQYILNAD
jgi:predicted phage terminase large subunit-like protein